MATLLGMANDDVLEFDRDIKTDRPLGITVGRLLLGRASDDGQPCVYLVLLPDGLHLIATGDAERFMHYTREDAQFGIPMRIDRDER